MKKALIAMSGGVDSSVAACLVKQEGFDCVGMMMKLYGNDDVGVENTKTCCSLEDVADARGVAHKLAMPFYVADFTTDFKTEVMDRFISGYQKGETPNPCIDCNRYMKFEKLYARAKQLGFDYVVTGHYASIKFDEERGRYLLKKSVDEDKDQSYVLYSMTQEQLAHTLFPLGGLQKSNVREIAETQGFINANKRDSQDICFVPDGDYAKFIEEYGKQTYKPGNFIDKQGNVLGLHKGVIRYTIGQRKGLGLAFAQPMYVCEKNAVENTVTLCEDKELFVKSLYATDFNWIACEKPSAPLRIKAKIRYKHIEQWAMAEVVADDLVHIEFDEPQRAIASGQAVVLYNGDIVVGGGRIK